jgi:undecaprenyl-diphosphatase
MVLVRLQNGCQNVFNRLDAKEMRCVRYFFSQSQEHPNLTKLILLLIWLGNGWLYVIICSLLLFCGGVRNFPIISACVFSTFSAFGFYWLLKPWLARTRPCDSDPSLASGIGTLDRYSCPSGHCMTAASVLVELGLTFPSISAAFGALWLSIAWSRVASAHHYPSDLVVGGAIGAAIGVTAHALFF